MNPITPEMWLLPYSAWTGIGWAHPGRYWCHCRMVYLPMSYLYGIRATGTVTPLVKALRCGAPRPLSCHTWLCSLAPQCRSASRLR